MNSVENLGDSPYYRPSTPPPETWRTRLSYLRRYALRKFENYMVWIWSYTLQRWIFVKRTSTNAHVEAATMRFVRKHTTIPVPRVWCVLNYRGGEFIFMTRVRGRDIYNNRVWESYSQSRRDKIIIQLGDMISQLRAISPPPQSPPFICNVLGGPVADVRLSTLGPYGPYRDEEQLNEQILRGLSPEMFAKLMRYPESIVEPIKQSHAIRHPIVLTHNDIAPRNIMVDGDKVTGLIDWECAGWFPAHWEYCKAIFACDDYFTKPELWLQDIKKFIPTFEFEGKVDTEMIAWTPDWVGVVLEPGYRKIISESDV